MSHEQKQELFRDLDEVCSLIITNEAWHAKAANECRNVGVRGWGKWHDKQSIIHKKCLDELSKMLQDKLSYSPQPSLERLQRINQFQINNLDDFIQHHFEWIKREQHLDDVLKYPLRNSKKVNRELHEKLEKLEEEAQHQISLVEKTLKRIRFAEFMAHDIGVCSKWIEDYFDYQYCPGDKINFNIG